MLNDHFIRFEREEGAQKVALKKLRPEDWEMLSVPKVRNPSICAPRQRYFGATFLIEKRTFRQQQMMFYPLECRIWTGGAFRGADDQPARSSL